MLIGVISDTHGHLHPQALVALRGAELILHAGDIGKQAIIDVLESIAPVLAVRGNSDAGTELARRYPALQRVEYEGVKIYMTHIGGKPGEMVRALPTEAEQRPKVVIFGHSHSALLEWVDDVLFLNPGAAGRPRFNNGLSVALLEVNAGQAQATIMPLESAAR
ncbi:MAG: metallophosphatase family protein [Chloroflexales bacterium]|nr:metallophosphatase family protein [Chloroflexales bacterium]